MKLTSALVLPLLLGGLVLTGCASPSASVDDEDASAGSTATPTDLPLATETATPSPTATATAGPSGDVDGDGGTDSGTDSGTVVDQTIAHVSVQPYGLMFENAEGDQLEYFAYSKAPSAAGARMQQVFGFAPTASPPVSPGDDPGFIFDGFTIIDIGASEPFNGRRWQVEVTAPSVRGITIDTWHGLHVGGPTGTLEVDYGGWRDAGQMRVIVPTTSDGWNNMTVIANNPYTTITKFVMPDGA